MYHHVLPKANNNLEVSVEEFEKQLRFLKDNHYKTLFFSDLIKGDLPNNTKAVILTFDDGYTDNLEYVYPLLRKYSMKATIMIPTALIDCDKDKMTSEQIKKMSFDTIELGLHSHSHRNFTNMNAKEISDDIDKNIFYMNERGLPFTNVIAYPYGQYPKRNAIKKKEMFSILKQKNIKYGIRIGNKINRYPFLSEYEVCRVHIKHTDNLLKFRLKLIFGRLAPF